MYKERVVFVTEDLSLPVDEGMKKFNHSLANYIRASFPESRIYARRTDDDATHTVHIGGKMFLSVKLLADIKRFNPQMIIYSPFSSGTLASFLRLFILKMAARQSRTVIVNLQRRHHNTLVKKIISLVRPCRVVVFSRRDFDYFTSMKLSPLFCRTGVDVNRFSPASIERKRELRTKHGLNINDTIILHVGHINSGRNIEVLKFLVREGRKVIVIGSTSTLADNSLKNDLVRSGIVIIDTFIENIEEIYQLSDLYVFPVINDHSAIEFPLSVLEAMACNLPVITTPYGALPDNFPGSEYLVYFSDGNEMADKADKILTARCNNRSLAVRFSWEKVLKELIDDIAIYGTVSDGN